MPRFQDQRAAETRSEVESDGAAGVGKSTTMVTLVSGCRHTSISEKPVRSGNSRSFFCACTLLFVGVFVFANGRGYWSAIRRRTIDYLVVLQFGMDNSTVHSRVHGDFRPVYLNSSVFFRRDLRFLVPAQRLTPDPINNRRGLGVSVRALQISPS